MKPSQVASKLRKIATTIDNSKNPRRDLVAADLKRIIAATEIPRDIVFYIDGLEETQLDPTVDIGAVEDFIGDFVKALEEAGATVVDQEGETIEVEYSDPLSKVVDKFNERGKTFSWFKGIGRS